MKHGVDYEKFEADLFAATADCYQTFVKKRGSSTICAFALYSDESASSISASANTPKHLMKATKEDPEDALYYKWSPAEWAYEGIESKKLDNLSRQLMEVDSGESDEQFANHRRQVFDLCVRVLQQHRQENLFSDVAADFILMFVSDYSDSEQQIGWIKSLNDVEVANEFEQVISENE